MIKQRVSGNQWNIQEFVQADPAIEEGTGLPLQLLKCAPASLSEENSPSALWFVSGFDGPTRNDAHICSLFQLAVSRNTFGPCVELFLTPVSNPSDSKKNDSLASSRFFNSFDDDTIHTAPAIRNQVVTLKRWARNILPKCLITFSLGKPKIRYQNVPLDLVSKLAELAEMPNYLFGEEPIETDQDGTPLARANPVGSLGHWCVNRDASWIDFSIDETKRSFDELCEQLWKPSIGPALKWLVEGFRFNPQKEIFQPLPTVIPVLEMPPEFANL